MSTAARVGIRLHSVLHDFETAHQRFTRLGIEPHQARRMALYATLRLTGVCSNAEAWEIVEEILGPQQSSHRQAGIDGTVP
jgi:hypothetical protein